MSKARTVKAKLLVARTGYGKPGDIVDYPADEAERHAEQGLVAPPPKPKPKGKARTEQTEGSDDDTEAGDTCNQESEKEAPKARGSSSQK